ncbi:MAG: hypothetical protein KC713_08615, partial [Candidatus Omnitrophica bacterium]|nr:hypothetical protein [Candidatus Omnitrophota bacterium]
MRKIYFNIYSAVLLWVLCATTLNGRFNRAPENVRPFLFEPCRDLISLESKERLLFRWRPSFPFLIENYDFRIYQGYKAYQQFLLKKVSIGKNTHTFEMPVSFFESGQ